MYWSLSESLFYTYRLPKSTFILSEDLRQLDNKNSQMASSAKATVVNAANQFIKFVNKCPSPFHVVDEIKKDLVKAGFKELREVDTWDIQPLNKYFVTRNQSTIIAFAVGGKFKPGNGFSIVGAHTDSPCLKVKPNSKKSKSGYMMVGVECYGGGTWHTWFDRDLTVAGRVLVKVSEISTKCPVLTTAVQAELQGDNSKQETNEADAKQAEPTNQAIGGALDEFIFSPRLDNLVNAYCATQVGSQSAQGADSTLQELILRRLSAGGSATAFEEAIPKSFMISADQAHAVHPNYSEKHESNHQAALHKGIVIKCNANQRYATTAITTTILREVAAKVDAPLQDFVVRNDSPCGSTIGPIMSSKLGMPTIDAFFEYYPSVFASLNF
ncbi:hypothetical protein KUTeg_015228 [Tegillarca granosa]|uniref:Aspartyl aminopeptidase n=1 Tax=Tegillarca granosa TaxID=220873 RepID=A0ABQ9EPJ2_TEGGR|nr:hypothetical protein KUTeg_015228 [Tegillarca granosa]